jgi:hypothetical protein
MIISAGNASITIKTVFKEIEGKTTTFELKSKNAVFKTIKK